MQDTSNIKTGDLVVGTSDPSKAVYSPTGSKIRDGVAIAGRSEDVARLQESILKSAVNMGGKRLSAESKKAVKGKKKKQDTKATYPTTPMYLIDETPQVYQPVITAPVIPEPTLETVIFENGFGKIRAKVEDVLEHDAAFMLIFSNDDEVVFEPKVGETLNFYRGKVNFQVYYPGVIFDWTDGIKKAMILFKADIENE